MWDLRDQSNEECFEFNFYGFLYWKLNLWNYFRFNYLFPDHTKKRRGVVDEFRQKEPLVPTKLKNFTLLIIIYIYNFYNKTHV